MPIMTSRLNSVLGIKHPIIQAPMAGGATTPELVATVSNAGALGSFAAALLPPSAIVAGVEQIRALTSRPFNVNLFVLEQPNPTAQELATAQARLETYRNALGLGAGTTPSTYCEDFQTQIKTLLELAPPLVSFTFGLLDASIVTQFQQAGSLVMGTATTVAEAKAWESTGADFVCVQGSEAGAHRGTFLGDFEQSSIGLMALVPQVVDAVKVPVIAAGGIMDGRGIAASLILGAQACQLGTAFLSCPESGIHPSWKRILGDSRDQDTRMTRVFSGKYARGIVNQFMEELRPFEQEIPAYPIQNALTGEIRKAAAKQDRTEFMSLWAGQGVAMSRQLPAEQLVKTLVDELNAILPDEQTYERA